MFAALQELRSMADDLSRAQPGVLGETSVCHDPQSSSKRNERIRKYRFCNFNNISQKITV